MERIRAAIANTDELKAVTWWVNARSNGSEPRFLKEQLGSLHALYENSNLPGLDAEFADLRGDLIDAVRDFLIANVGPSV